MKKIISRLGSHIVEGVEYPNLPSIADEYGMSLNTIYKRYSRGHRGDNLIPEKKRKNYVKKIVKPNYKYIIDGVGYKSKRQACKINNINEITVRKRIERGWSLKDALTTPARFHYVVNDDAGSGTAKCVNVNGRYFRTVADAAREYGLIPENVQSALKSGLTINQALKLDIRPTRDSFYFEGNFYRDKEHLCRKLNFSTTLLRNRLNRGLTIREAINLGSNHILSKGRYNLTILKRDPILAKKPAKLYFARTFINENKRYKIGITTQKVINRLSAEFQRYKILKLIKETLLNCYLLEKKILINFSKYRDKSITPEQMDGYTEVFDLPENEVENIKSILDNNLKIV